ncbi:MAG: hypothetical protein AABY08_03470 [Candidatus Thermoplasmatota archaeon]
MLSELKGDRSALAPLREAHLAYRTGLKERGKMLLADRFGDGRGGIYIPSTADEAEARQAWQQMKAEIARASDRNGQTGSSLLAAAGLRGLLPAVAPSEPSPRPPRPLSHPRGQVNDSTSGSRHGEAPWTAR